jgi:hypothetical protein
MPFARAATCLRQMGLNVDRWSVRNYAMKNIREIPTTEQYGIVLPESILSLVALTSDTLNGDSIGAMEILIACGFPSSPKPEVALEKP